MTRSKMEDIHGDPTRLPSALPPLLVVQLTAEDLTEKHFFHFGRTIRRSAEDRSFIADFFNFSFELLDSGLGFVSHAVDSCKGRTNPEQTEEKQIETSQREFRGIAGDLVCLFRDYAADGNPEHPT